MANQERRSSKSEIETRRWQIGTAIGVIGLVLAAAALWPDQNPKPVYLAPPPLPAPENFRPESKQLPPAMRPPSDERELPPKKSSQPMIERKPFSVPLEPEERKTIIAALIAEGAPMQEMDFQLFCNDKNENKYDDCNWEKRKEIERQKTIRNLPDKILIQRWLKYQEGNNSAEERQIKLLTSGDNSSDSN